MTDEFKIDYDNIAQICYDFYEKNLVVKSKPAKNEWTNMAAILVSDPKDLSKFKILSMATGSKCLAEKQLPLNGSLIHDSHAEILTRRCFIRFVYNEILQILKDKNYKSEVLEFDNENFCVKNGLNFVLFTSHTPCGDASIIPKISFKREAQEEFNESKKLKLDNSDKTIDDIHRTGAKCVPNSVIQDPKEKGIYYHVTGVVRTKPGRGDPTISMSCSDKIAKWLVLGIQGSLLSNFLKKPIYLKAIVIGKCPFNEESIKRGLISRSKDIITLSDKYKLMEPIIGQSNLVFKDSKLSKDPTSIDLEDESNFKACPNSICWTYGVKTRPIFVLVKGFLQGACLKNSTKSSNFPPICKYSLYENFKEIFKLVKNQEGSESILFKTYSNAKKLDLEYNKFKDEFFKVYKDWIRTDPNKYYNFQ